MKLINVSTRTHPNTFAKVDDEDYERVGGVKWYAHKDYGTFYVRRTVRINGKNVSIRLHRFILGTAAPHIDHVDHDGLNNQRANLRACDASLNQRNSLKRQTTAESRFKGVSWHATMKQWRVRITLNRKVHYLGYYPCEGCAAIAYDNAARREFGEFASPNFP